MLKLIVDKIEDVAEAFRDLYEPKDGKWHLKVEGIEDNTQIKADLRKATNEAATRRKAVEKWEKLGKTPEEIEELLTKLAKDEEDKLNQKGEWDKLRQQMVEKHTTEINSLKKIITDKDGEIAAMNTSLENHLVDSQLTAAIAEHKGIPTLLLPHAKKLVKVVKEENGTYTTKVMNEKGEPRVNAKGEPLPVSDLIQEMRSNEVFGRAFEGNGTSGSGTQPGGGNGGNNTSPIKRRSEFKSEAERAAYVDQYSVEAYQKLPA